MELTRQWVSNTHIRQKRLKNKAIKKNKEGYYIPQSKDKYEKSIL